MTNARCRQLAPYLAAAADEIDLDTTTAVAEHIETCAGCRRVSVRFAGVRAAVAEASLEVEPPADLVPAILARTVKSSRKAVPFLPVPPMDLVRMVQDNREIIAGAAGAAVVAAGAAWALWKVVRGATRPAPVQS